ncbi:MAG TPA: VWA domain-containing protein [Thermoanaerobaculia bacterium]|nr:VWA domain-containing protein [Thermoanaerobaculia bacterium]
MNRSILLLALITTLPIVAQQKLPPAEETIDVSIVNVDVFVTDKKGRRVSGLTSDDFEIRENGRVQPITNFAEYGSGASDAAAAAKAPHAKRTILVFIERFALPNFRTEPLFTAIRKTLREVVRPGDSAAVVFWDLDAAFTLQDFTDDLPSLEAALAEVEKQNTGAPGSNDLMRQRALARSFLDNLPPERLRGRRTLDNFDLWDLRSNANFGLFRFERKAEELQALMRSMSDEDGRKIVIFATDDFGLYPETMAFSGELAQLNRAEYGTTQYREAVARTANEHNITIYPFYPVGLELTPMVSAAENRPDIFASQQRIDPRMARDFEVLVNQTAALDELAKETGGLMASGATEIVSVLPEVAQDLETYYSLAYRTPDTGTTKSRDIIVRAKKRDYTVRTRREYVEKTDVTRMQDRVIANLYRPDGKGRIPLDVDLGAIEKERKHWTVPVRIRIPIEALSIGRNDTGTFSVFIATGGILGIMSDVERRTQPFSFADIAPEQTHFTYDFTMRFNGATSTVSIGVFDERTKDFGLQTVDLPAFHKELRAGGE